jgi:arylsulfatase A-like enzyme
MTNDGTEPYAGFGGTVGRTVAGSESWWPQPPTSPAGAPNVIVILADDLGYSDLGCYGSEIATPTLDRLAGAGLQFTDFHVTPMCSPTRAALLTGLNPHAAGVGHVAHSDSGFPGYAMELADNAITAAEIYRANGYFTAMVGKWHLTKDSNCSDAGPFHSWPCQRGFDRFYGILDGFTNFHQPHRLVEDNHPVEIDQYPDDYYFTDDITDRAIEMIKGAKGSNPSQPFFLYLSHGAVHAPLQAKAEDIARQRGRYDGGWDELRDRRFAALKQLGLIDADTVLPPRNSEFGNEVAAWADLSDDERRLFARYMEVYAAMVENVDSNTGRLLHALDQMGELDNTIVLFTSDNGASREGEVEGTTGYFVHLLGDTDVEADLARIDEIGGPTTIPHYPRGWAMACNTPYRLYKINAHQGGHSVPMMIQGPGIEAGGRRGQFTHVTDVLPTLMEMCGIESPSERHGRRTKTTVGESFVPVIGDAAVPTAHTEQYIEMIGHRGYYRDGWEAVTLHAPLTPFDDGEWELYDLTTDPTETNDLASEMPERVAELAEAWDHAARDNQVYPLDEGSGLKFMIRPPWDDVFGEPVTLLPGTPTLERWRSLQLIMIRSFSVVARVEISDAGEGIVVAHGDQGGGYVMWLDGAGVHLGHNDGRGRFATIDGPRPAAGPVVIQADFEAPGGNVWNMSLGVGDQIVDTTDSVPCLFPMAPFEGIDIGLDRRSPVSWDLYAAHGPYPFTGKINSVDYVPGEPAPDAPQSLVGLLREMGSKFE